MSLEYRVTWQREGKPKRGRIYQTRSGADSLMEVLSTSPDEPPDSDHWSDTDFARWKRMTAPFSQPPALEQREVGEWESAT